MNKLFFFAFIILHFSFLNAQTADELNQQALDLLEKKEYKAALKLIDKAIEISDKEKSFYLTKIEIYIGLEDFGNVGITFNEAVKLFPDEYSFYARRGVLLTDYNEFDLALTDYETALTLATSDTIKSMIYSNMSISKKFKRDFYGAYQDLLKAYAIDSSNIGILNNLGGICDEVGKPEEALKYINRVIELDSEFIGAYSNIGFHHQSMNNHIQAITYFDIAIKKSPDSDLALPYAYNNRAYSKLKLNDLEGALNDVNKSIELGKFNSYAYRNRALIYLEQGKTKKACADIETAIEYKFTEMYGDEMVQLQKKHCY